ncbi:MaoC family dehydratase N-terminal domain-containing protein [Virgibacillus halodenitrificans]|uniref:MaoC family dehydratase N-terminal domain-containing protein n=1 Tax=Virgibacillus halodenitrificans TaxID=1482 RepID=A0ABR7VSL3_VIRHA|nr:MaoC family dehydratase N-terminal domain-containing protein [Virgibacillus halodenitrificans]MBD1224361.1 MaoC family dehydratase N-terminal domain-containing protein [Virgibacillus halodenitrificans]MCG1029351.1 MaoC family dehydratase N-terminal domain-containing protein [Virgibacillus halodenitrificans]MCJ0931453.1 MaoC family dehydratase N-terminal domain-containing protein [Virgibacillus halodenitrificans]MEC2158521.1 MaoC family dehydratase N-terminal domain-containing protein [Virgib
MELDNSIIGMTGESFTFEVEKGHIKRFAEAIGDNNPLYINQEYAEKTPYQSVIAPPTFLIAAGANGGDLPLELDTKRMLHGEQEFIYYKSVRPGDSLQCQMKVSDLYEREGKSGSMQFLILDTEMKDPQGELVAISRMNIIYRKI